MAGVDLFLRHPVAQKTTTPVIRRLIIVEAQKDSATVELIGMTVLILYLLCPQLSRILLTCLLT